MKKVIFCIALALVSMMTAAVSFMVNDVATYKEWAAISRPRIMENFGHKDKKDRGPEDRRDDRKGPMKDDRKAPPPKEEKSHHDKEKKSHEAPAAATPAGETQAAN